MNFRPFFRATVMLAALPLLSATVLAAPSKAVRAKTARAGIGGLEWGTTQKGDHVQLFTLTGKGGMVARITNFGGVVVDLMVPDRHGKATNGVLGYDGFASYEKGGVYNAPVRRYANPLAVKFLVAGKIYEQPPLPPRPAAAGSAPP